jgi:hypothetical protein
MLEVIIVILSMFNQKSKNKIQEPDWSHTNEAVSHIAKSFIKKKTGRFWLRK